MVKAAKSHIQYMIMLKCLCCLYYINKKKVRKIKKNRHKCIKRIGAKKKRKSKLIMNTRITVGEKSFGGELFDKFKHFISIFLVIISMNVAPTAIVVPSEFNRCIIRRIYLIEKAITVSL